MQVAPGCRQPNGAIVFGGVALDGNGRASSPSLRLQTHPVHTRGITFVSPVPPVPPGQASPGVYLQNLQAPRTPQRSPSPGLREVRAASPPPFPGYANGVPVAQPGQPPPMLFLFDPAQGQHRQGHQGRSSVDPMAPVTPVPPVTPVVAMSPRTASRSKPKAPDRPMACATWANNNLAAKQVHKMDSVAEEECESVTTECAAASIVPAPDDVHVGGQHCVEPSPWPTFTAGEWESGRWTHLDSCG